MDSLFLVPLKAGHRGGRGRLEPVVAHQLSSDVVVVCLFVQKKRTTTWQTTRGIRKRKAIYRVTNFVETCRRSFVCLFCSRGEIVLSLVGKCVSFRCCFYCEFPPSRFVCLSTFCPLSVSTTDEEFFCLFCLVQCRPYWEDRFLCQPCQQLNEYRGVFVVVILYFK